MIKALRKFLPGVFHLIDLDILGIFTLKLFYG